MLASALLVVSLRPAAFRIRPSSSAPVCADRAVHRRSAWPTLQFGSASEYKEHLTSQGSLPEGFRVGVHGFKFTPKEADMQAVMNITLIALDRPTSSFAGVFTRNSFCGAPVTVGKKRIEHSAAIQAVVINNKISNVCAAGDGVQSSEDLCAAVASALELEGGADAVIPCSTGVIGWALPVEKMVEALPATAAKLQADSVVPAAYGIMTTDRFPKLRTYPACGGRLVGIAKGAGMIEPNMATMLSFILTDVDVPKHELQAMLRRVVDVSFNCVSVDADQSTSDTMLCLSSAVKPLPPGEAALAEFEAALTALATDLAEDIVRNGEGTSHVIRVHVSGAPSSELARGVGKAVVNSNLFKTAVAGNDPNVGRLVAAVGSYLGKVAPELDVTGCRMSLGGQLIFHRGKFDLDPTMEKSLSAHMSEAILTGSNGESLKYPRHQRCVEVGIEMGLGDCECTVFGSDMTTEYVEINADYRS
ncbi:hypothetical protein AB1Y20_013120 [Prymnesium parvum]|uniref:Arginine biosynthesis bifunctional protein ArgJ, mitochondrial n=1 Tax=Prymnesium parvum TaxID=97485 RepID=A0AB34IKJ5_PRYPA